MSQLSSCAWISCTSTFRRRRPSLRSGACRFGSQIRQRIDGYHRTPPHVLLRLMPFLQANNDSAEYRRLGFVLQLWPLIYVMGLLAAILGQLPSFFRRWALAGHTKNMDAPIAEFTVSSMLSFSTVWYERSRS